MLFQIFKKSVFAHSLNISIFRIRVFVVVLPIREQFIFVFLMGVLSYLEDVTCNLKWIQFLGVLVVNMIRFLIYLPLIFIIQNIFRIDIVILWLPIVDCGFIFLLLFIYGKIIVSKSILIILFLLCLGSEICNFILLLRLIGLQYFLNHSFFVIR